MAEPWREVGDRVLVRRHASFDLNVGLVVGDGACLVVDTRCSLAEGRDLVDALRRVTNAPWQVVATHAHFDHCFGTGAFVPTTVWAQERAAAAIKDRGEADRERVAQLYDRDGQPEVAEQVRQSPLVVPDRLVDQHQVLDVGGRRVELRHVGRGHTDHDLVVVVEDAGVVLAGDLVEEGAPPQFRDAHPLDWPGTLDAMLTATPAATVVPGHGDVVDRAFVTAQRDVLQRLVDLATDGHGEGRPAEDVASELPELGAFALEAVHRAYAARPARPVEEGQHRAHARHHPDHAARPLHPPGAGGRALRDQHLALSAVTGADVVPDGLAAVRGLRAPGLGLPGYRKIGTWRRRHGRSLVVTRRGRPALRVRLTGHPYEELLLDVADPERAAAALAGR